MNEKNLMDWILPRLKRDILDMTMSRSTIVELSPDNPDPNYRRFAMVTMLDVREILDICFADLIGGVNNGS